MNTLRCQIGVLRLSQTFKENWRFPERPLCRAPSRFEIFCRAPSRCKKICLHPEVFGWGCNCTPCTPSFAAHDYDVLFIQETHLTESSIPYFDNLCKGKCYHSCYTNRTRGVCILIKQTLNHQILKVERDDCGNFIFVLCKLGTQTYLFAHLLMALMMIQIFYHDLVSRLNLLQTDHTIIGGDFNFLIDTEVDSFNYVREYNMNAKQVFFSKLRK